LKDTKTSLIAVLILANLITGSMLCFFWINSSKLLEENKMLRKAKTVKMNWETPTKDEHPIVNVSPANGINFYEREKRNGKVIREQDFPDKLELIKKGEPLKGNFFLEKGRKQWFPKSIPTFNADANVDLTSSHIAYFEIPTDTINLHGNNSVVVERTFRIYYEERTGNHRIDSTVYRFRVIR
jgi:hypothetical protein